MHPAIQSPPDDTVFIIVLGISLLIVGIVYIMPSIVAFRRSHPNRWIILVINIAFGGTVIGWGIALVWALPIELALQAAGANPASTSSSTM